MTQSLNVDAKPGMGWRSRIFVLPLVVSAFIGIAFAIGLTRNPRELPSMLIDKPVPKFELPAVQGRKLGLSSGNLVGEVSLVNVFASWCTQCRAEHPILMELAASKLVSVHGLNYKDKPNDAQNWLDELGDPYTRTGADIKGRVAIDWGVYGVPETFVINKKGIIIHKHIGAINAGSLKKTIIPLIKKLQAQN